MEFHMVIPSSDSLTDSVYTTTLWYPLSGTLLRTYPWLLSPHSFIETVRNEIPSFLSVPSLQLSVSLSQLHHVNPWTSCSLMFGPYALWHWQLILNFFIDKLLIYPELYDLTGRIVLSIYSHCCEFRALPQKPTIPYNPCMLPVALSAVMEFGIWQLSSKYH